MLESLFILLGIYLCFRSHRQNTKNAELAQAANEEINGRLEGHERVMMTLRRDHEALVKEMQKMKCRVGQVKAKLERSA